MKRPSRKTIVLVAVGLALSIAALLFADWREWIDRPDFWSAESQRFDRFYIMGDAPWCFLADSHDSFVGCHYLSEMHCMQANYVFFNQNNPDENGQCVPRPLKPSWWVR
jgi:hypothetical protein